MTFKFLLLFRFDKITFRRPEDAVDSVKETSSAKVQVLVFEIEDREMIGGSAYGGQKAICCTSDLAKLGACTEGSVIYRPSQVNPGWPKLFVASFDGSDLIAMLPSRTIPINKLGCTICTLYTVILHLLVWRLRGKPFGKILLGTFQVGWHLLRTFLD